MAENLLMSVLLAYMDDTSRLFVPIYKDTKINSH